MTCAECRDLLLDLAYGELSPASAAEVEEHARGCTECGAQLEELRRARKLVAPLASTVEPPAALDEKILEAARAEAFLLAGGTPGTVVETKAREQARAVEAASIDARAQVRRPPSTRRRAWALRAAVAGSVAAVAGLLVLVSTSGRKPERQMDDEAFRIQIRAPQEDITSPSAAPAPSAIPSPAEKQAAEKKQAAATRPATPAPARRAAGVAEEKKRKEPAPKAEFAENAAAPAPFAAAPRADALVQKARPEREPAVGGTAGPVSAEAYGGDAAKTGGEGGPEAEGRSKVALPASRGEQAQAAAAPAVPEDPTALERSAEAARRQGAYAAAASLYREAARQRRGAGDPDTASWDLAHAVECLAAAGEFTAARAARRELGQLHPGAGAAQAAADRALRTAPPEPAQDAVR